MSQILRVGTGRCCRFLNLATLGHAVATWEPSGSESTILTVTAHTLGGKVKFEGADAVALLAALDGYAEDELLFRSVERRVGQELRLAGDDDGDEDGAGTEAGGRNR